MSQSRNSNSTIAVGRDHEAAALDIRDDVVKEQLIKQVQKNFNIPILINSVITILMMVVLRDVVAAHILFSWGLISLGWNAICYLYHRRFDDSSAQFTELLRWVHSFSISVGITGLLWGVAGILFFQPDYPQFQVFLAFVLGGLAAGAVVAYAFWLPAFYAFVAPSLLPLVIRFGYEQDELSILMGGMLALFVVTISFLARSSHESLAKSILLQVDKQILLDEITKSEEKYRNLVELSHDLIWSVDTDGNYTFVNQASSITHGYEPDEMIGKPFSEFMTPEQAKLDLVVFEQIKKGEKYIELETIHQRKDGSPVHLSFNAVVAYDEEGNVIGTTGTAKDLTSRKLSEEQSRLHREQLAHVSRVATMGEMATGIAHELNQPLAAIAAYIDGSIRRMKSGEPVSTSVLEALERASNQAIRAGNIIQRLRDFIRRDEQKSENININDTVNAARQILIADFDLNQVDLKLDLAQNLPTVKGDPILIQQVILNLVRNSVEAMKSLESSSGELVISTFAENDTISLRIVDNGPGIEPNDQERLFDPYFSTKKSGLGMGLPICHSIVTEYGGQIWYEPAPKQGAAFHIRLPSSKTDNAG